MIISNQFVAKDSEKLFSSLISVEDMHCFSYSFEDMRTSDVRGLWMIFSFPSRSMFLFYFFSVEDYNVLKKGINRQ